jgi:hypothetical protein
MTFVETIIIISKIDFAVCLLSTSSQLFTGLKAAQHANPFSYLEISLALAGRKAQ